MEAKLKGKEIVTPDEEEPEREVINLMDALRKSLRAKRPTQASTTRRRQTRRRVS